MLALFRHFTLPLAVSMPVAWMGGQFAGIVALAGAAAYSIWSWRTRKSRGGAVLSVDGDVLAVEIRGRRVCHERLHLGDLATVALEVKTIERVMDGSSAIPAMRFIDSKVGPKVDTARIVLVTAGREVALTRSYLPHMHVPWRGAGKIRTFLRKHGWVPEDERESLGKRGCFGCHAGGSASGER